MSTDLLDMKLAFGKISCQSDNRKNNFEGSPRTFGTNLVYRDPYHLVVHMFGAVGADDDAKSLSIPGCFLILIIEENSLLFVRQMILSL